MRAVVIGVGHLGKHHARIFLPNNKGHDLVARSRTYAGKLRTAQQRLDSRLELAGAEGFAQVIIGAQFQANHPIGFVGTGGEHDDGDLGKTRMLTHPAA